MVKWRTNYMQDQKKYKVMIKNIKRNGKVRGIELLISYYFNFLKFLDWAYTNIYRYYSSILTFEKKSKSI